MIQESLQSTQQSLQSAQEELEIQKAQVVQGNREFKLHDFFESDF